MKFCLAQWYLAIFYLFSFVPALSIMFLAPSEIRLIEIFFCVVSVTDGFAWSTSSFIVEPMDWIETSPSAFGCESLLIGWSISLWFLKVWIKYCRRFKMCGFYFFSWLIETASGMVSMRPPVGQVAIMLNGLSHSLSLCVSKIVLNFLISWDANYSWVRLSGLLTMTDTIP